MLCSIYKLPLIEWVCVVNLTSLTVGQVVQPLPFEEKLRSWELAFSVGFVIPYLSSVEAAVFAYEQSQVTLGDSIVKAAFIDRPIIINDSSESVGQSVFPLTLIVGTEGKEVVELQFDALSFRGVDGSWINGCLR